MDSIHWLLHNEYNPVINEEVASMASFTDLHPHQPIETVQGALEVEYNIQRALASITGMADAHSTHTLVHMANLRV